MNETQQALWIIADELRSQPAFSQDPLGILLEAHTRGLTLQIDDVRWFLIKYPGLHVLVLPKFITQFISAYLADRTVSSLLDIWTYLGETSIALTQELQPSRAFAIGINTRYVEIAKTLGYGNSLEWMNADPFRIVPSLTDEFDLILGAPPFNYHPNRPFEVVVDETKISGRDYLDKQLIMQASLQLDRDGVGFFVTSPDFLSQDRRGSVYSQFPALGLHLEAALSLPGGTFSHLTSLPGLLLIVRKQHQEKFLMGELTSDKNSQLSILNNLRKRREGRIPQQGRWVEPYTYSSLNQILLRQEIENLGRRQPFPPVPLPSILKALNMAKRNNDQPFKDLPNAVYLPLIGTSPAVASLSELNIKPHNYAQLLCDTEKIMARYLAKFLNSPLGIMIREVNSGGFIPKLSKKRLNALHVYLPDVRVQLSALKVQSKLESARGKVNELEERLWQNPDRASEIGRETIYIGRGDKLEDWIDTLPFPLASILWAYLAEKSPRDKGSHLLHFFEALSQFHATIMLSAYASDQDFYQKEARNWLETKPEFLHWYKRPSFGSWNIFSARLAKSTRRFLNDTEVKDHCLRLFGQPEVKFLEMLANKRMVTVLNEACEYRNSWRGHGGIAGGREYQRRLDLLEENLATVRQLVSNNYGLVRIIFPESNRFSNGIYRYQARLLRGTRFPFRQITIKTSIILEDGFLYLAPKDQLRPVKLLPIFRLMESPQTQQNACYFFNRVNGEEIRWVSYHFETEAEILREGPEMGQVFDLLDPGKIIL